jgi:hypothetical protein
MDNPNNVITESADKVPTDITAATPEALLMYKELCGSYAIDDFRMKLLGFLPLTSLIGIFGLSNTSLFTQNNEISRHLIIFVGIFAAAFTLALFLYEIRGIVRCSNLIARGRDIEVLMNVRGQFSVCMEEHEPKKNEGLPAQKTSTQKTNIFDAKLAACVIYSIVFAAWLFMVLRFGYNHSIRGCVFSALGVGLVIGVGSFLLLRKYIAA